MTGMTLDYKPEEVGLFGARALVRAIAAWWDTAGTHIFNGTKSVVQAFEELGMFFNVDKFPAVAQMEEEPMALFQEFIRSGVDPVQAFEDVLYRTFLPVPGHHALVRSRTDDDQNLRPFDIAGDGYQPLQNEAFARIMDKIVEMSGDGGEPWTLETVISLSRGRRNVVCLNAGKTSLTDDEILQNYLVALSEHKVGRGVKVWNSEIRPLCHNTLSRSKAEAETVYTIPHMGDVAAEFEFTMQIMKMAHEQQEEAVRVFRAMMATPLDKEQRQELVEVGIPFVTMPDRVHRFNAYTSGQLDPELAETLP